MGKEHYDTSSGQSVFIAEYVLTILILAFSAYRKNAFDWRKTIRRKTFIKRMLFLIPVALIAIGIMTAAYLLQLPQMTTLVIITGAQLFLTLIANVILFSSWFQRYRVYPGERNSPPSSS